MEQITKRENVFYYGDRLCGGADEAYREYRDDYHEALGKRVYRRLNRIGQREERIHGFGFVFDADTKRESVLPGVSGRVVPVRLLGLICGSYCWVLGAWDMPEFSEEKEFEDWFDCVFSSGSGCVRKLGRKDKAGRTGKMLKKRYR